ncbi:MAG: hypothetical protein P8J74_04585, partial [Woeseiaceae bacterium]|nr:hypothetical protein [Woeseiaceae bacterium]
IFIELINNNQLDEFITKTLIPYGKFFVEQTGWPPDHISRYNFRTIEGFEKICIREKQNYK